MKLKVCALIFGLFLMVPAMSVRVNAQAGSANGYYKFLMEDQLMKYVEFDARTDDRGNTSGYMIFTDEAKVLFIDGDGTGEKPPDESESFSMTADLDAMTIDKNRAVMSGTIRDSNYRSFIGKYVRLVIEDNDGIEVPDRVSWCFCQPEQGGWIPEDSEVPGDRGAYMSWWATDAEVKGDVGIPSQDLIPGNLKSCRIYPLWAYDFAPIAKGEGVIKIIQ
jgi:hypothetical protein